MRKELTVGSLGSFSSHRGNVIGCCMRAVTALLALSLTAPPVLARCEVGRLPAVLCTTGFYAGQFGAFYRDASVANRIVISPEYVEANGCTPVPRTGIQVFPTGSRYVVPTRAPGGDTEVVRIEVEGLPPVYVAAVNLTGDCRRR